MYGKILVTIALFACSCSDVPLSGNDHFRLDEPEYGLTKTQTRPGVTYRVQYLPDYARKAAEKNGDASPSPFYYFRFNISSAHFNDNREAVQYMHYQMQPDFTLKMHLDSIPCVFYQAIPKAIGNDYEFLVAFETDVPPASTEIEFIFHDKVVKNQAIVFPYTLNDFQKNDNRKAE